MFASLNRVADIEYINKDENSLFEMLNSGKIVIVNCDNLDNAILAILLSATLDGLTKKMFFKYKNRNFHNHQRSAKSFVRRDGFAR